MDPQTIITAVAQDLALELRRVAPAAQLLDEGNTIPFVARYRKEVTGSLDEDQLRQIEERLRYRRNMEERRETILNSLTEQGVLTPELEADVRGADTLQRLEDLYLPYKPKRQTRATLARAKGLQPLADLILKQTLDGDRDALGQPFLKEDVPSLEEAFAGARDIVAERIADDPDVRAAMRSLVQRHGTLKMAVADQSKDPDGVYEMYYNFFGDFRGMKPHQILAINRAESEGVLKIQMEAPEAEGLGAVAQRFPVDMGSPLADDLLAARKDGYQRLLLPAIEREMRRQLTDQADAHAIGVFATNMRALLLQPPLRGQTVLGIDPGYRTGCKIAVINATGKVLDTDVIYPDRDKEQAKTQLQRLVKKYCVTVIDIGNGTAGRETEALVAEVIGEAKLPVKYAIVNEAGASVYSASKLARQELPDLDVSLRGAVSIARRLQDPLAELVKIEPKAIGVGLYQHDVNQKSLGETLDTVVESTVNTVGADLNTASPALLQYISGIGPKLAETIVAHRDAQGAFTSRADLRGVPGVGPKTFQQAAGFLRIPGSEEPLDNTPIHPESYPAARAVLTRLGLPLGHRDLPQAIAQLRRTNLAELAAEVGVGVPTLNDILDALARPGRDPRDDLAGPMLRSDVLSIEDLRPAMRLKGTVRNVVDFGAFVDIGVKRDGLIHISRMGTGFVRNPHDKVAVGNVVEVEVVDVDVKRGRINLALIE